MKRIRNFPVLVLLALWLTGCGQDGVYSGRLVLGGEWTAQPGVVETTDILLADGVLTIPPGAEVRGDIYQFFGTLTIDGTVAGDVFQMGGNLTIGPQASVSGRIVRGAAGVPLAPDMVQRSRGGGWLFAVTETLLLSALALLVGRFAPLQLERVAAVIRHHAIVGAAMGLLVAIVGLCLVVQMAFTVLLIPLSLLGILLLLFSIGYGWVGFGLLTGRWLSDRLGRHWPAGIAASAGTLVFMTFLNVLGLLLLGDLAAIASAIIGLGAAFLTRFGLRAFSPATAD